MDVRVGPERRLSTKSWCFRIMMLEKTLESPMDCKENKAVNPKGNQPWIFIGRTDAKASVLWPPDAKRLWCWERLTAGGEGDDRGWGSEWLSLTWWTWVWANSWRWWRTEKPGVLHSTGSQSWTWLSDWTTKGGDRWVAKMVASPLWVGQDWCLITVISGNFSTLKRKLGPKVILSLNFPLPEDEILQWTPQSWVAILGMGG